MEHTGLSPLTGKRILFLGSSVTYGAASGGESFADQIAARNGCLITKEAVSGTTLADDSADSYIARLRRISREQTFDLAVCQLSTNDATQQKPLGDASEEGGMDAHTNLMLQGKMDRFEQCRRKRK